MNDNLSQELKKHYNSSLKEVEKKQTTFNNDVNENAKCVYFYNKKYYCVIF